MYCSIAVISQRLIPPNVKGELGASVLFSELSVRLLIGRVYRYLNNALGLRHSLVWFSRIQRVTEK